MRVAVGDRIVIRNHRLGEQDRSGIVLSVEGDDGAPPYRMRWDDDHESVFVPSGDATVEHLPAVR